MTDNDNQYNYILSECNNLIRKIKWNKNAKYYWKWFCIEKCDEHVNKREKNTCKQQQLSQHLIIRNVCFSFSFVLSANMDAETNWQNICILILCRLLKWFSRVAASSVRSGFADMLTTWCSFDCSLNRGFPNTVIVFVRIQRWICV